MRTSSSALDACVFLAAEASIAKRASHPLSRRLRTDGFTSCRRATCSPDTGWPDRKAMHGAGKRPHTMTGERWRRATRAAAAESGAPKESVSLRHLRSEPTWENGVEHSGFLWFADTEEVTGSNPVAPTTVLAVSALSAPSGQRASPTAAALRPQ